MATEIEKAYQKRYRSSPKGRATIERYRTSPRRQAWLREYQGSERCREAQRRYDAARRGKRLADHYLREYNITLEDRDAMFAAQGNCCASCKSPDPGTVKGWMLDHCHTTKKVRGVLCHHCNLALGNVKDSIATLEALTAYLRGHQ